MTQLFAVPAGVFVSVLVLVIFDQHSTIKSYRLTCSSWAKAYQFQAQRAIDFENRYRDLCRAVNDGVAGKAAIERRKEDIRARSRGDSGDR